MITNALLLHWAALPTAFFLDLCLGDPSHGHPVRLMGRAIVWTEPLCRRLPFSPLVAGACLAITLVLTAFTAGLVLTALGWLDEPKFECDSSAALGRKPKRWISRAAMMVISASCSAVGS